MALIEYRFAPGIDKQSSDSGAENRWIDSDNVRFRYGQPEKVGGWSSLVTKTTLTSATIATTNGSPTCTITKSAHGLSVGDIVQLDSVTLPGGTGFSNSDFEDKNFQVITVPTNGTFTITQSSNATGTVSTGGSLSLKPYEPVGPRAQTYGYGWGVSSWGGGGWGQAASASSVALEPGLWSLDNFGEVLIATIANGKTFTWNGGAASPLTNRASTTTTNFSTANNPTASRVTLVSPTTRHLIHLATETTIGNTTTQDDMFIRFSNQEGIDTYAPSATNTAGTQRLQDGTKIVGALKAKESILIWTDNALYTMKFIGAPFTFGFEQVGTNCGLIGKNAAIEIDGVAFWMSPKGFFAFDGTVRSLPCSVEDHVFENIDTTKGQQINAGLNNLFTEVVWYYPSSGSEYNDKYVIYNYGESSLTKVPGGVWYTGTEARTSWVDATIYPKPFATKYDSTSDGTFPAIVGQSDLGQTTLFEHEIGTDQVNPNGTTTTVTSFIKSYDIDLESRMRRTAQGGVASGAVAGEFFLALRRFVPDFKTLAGNCKISLGIKRYPQDSQTTTALSPFTVNSNTLKKDTRARGRFLNIKIENDAASESWRFGTLKLDLQQDGRR